MSLVRHHKIVSALPSELEASAIYYVRRAGGFDQFVTNESGMVVAYPLNMLAAAATAAIRALSGSGAITASGVADALSFVTVPYGSTTIVDMAAGVNFRCTMTGNISVLTLSNVMVDKVIELELLGNNETARAVAYHSNFAGDLPPLTDISSSKGVALTIKAMTATRWNVVSRRSL